MRVCIVHYRYVVVEAPGVDLVVSPQKRFKAGGGTASALPPAYSSVLYLASFFHTRQESARQQSKQHDREDTTLYFAGPCHVSSLHTYLHCKYGLLFSGPYRIVRFIMQFYSRGEPPWLALTNRSCLSRACFVCFKLTVGFSLFLSLSFAHLVSHHIHTQIPTYIQRVWRT